MSSLKYAVNLFKKSLQVEAIPIFGFTSGKGSADSNWISKEAKNKGQLEAGMNAIFGARNFSLVTPFEKAKLYFQPGAKIDRLRFNITDRDQYIPASDGKVAFFGKFTIDLTDIDVISFEKVPQNKFLPKLSTMNYINNLSAQSPGDGNKWLTTALVLCRLGDNADFKVEETNQPSWIFDYV